TAIVGRNGELEGWIGFSARRDGNMALGLEADGPDAAPLTPGQVRAARGYLGWSAEQLAEHAGVSFSTVRRVETPGERGVREQSIAAIRKALERAGISFTTGVDGRTGVFMK
ncbi:MAG TPA: helix-turn-helix transcriptional regulator, partial [Devosia sp.]